MCLYYYCGQFVRLQFVFTEVIVHLTSFCSCVESPSEVYCPTPVRQCRKDITERILQIIVDAMGTSESRVPKAECS